MPTLSYWGDGVASRHKYRRARRQTREMEVQTDTAWMPRESLGTREARENRPGFHELSMMDLPSVGEESRDAAGGLPSVGKHVVAGAVDLRRSDGEDVDDYFTSARNS